MTITPFDYRDQPVRVVTINGEPWFMAADIAGVLDLGNMHSSLSSLDDDERGLHSMETPGGAQDVAIVSEAGMYSLILRSRKPEAKLFKRWITHQVLPAIRKTGAYGVPQLTRRELAAMVIEAEDALAASEDRRLALEAQTEADAPKVVFADAVASSQTSILVRELAKLAQQAGIDVGPQRLFEWLRRDGFLIRQSAGDYNLPTQKSKTLGLFEIKETPIVHDDGRVTINRTPKVTGKGQTYLINYYLKRGVA